MTVVRRLKIIVDQEGNAQPALKGLSGILGSFGGAAKLAAGGIGLLGSAAVAAGGFLVSLGSDAEEMQGKFDTVFKTTAPQVTQELDKFGDAVGRNRFELMGYAATLGDTLKPMGFTEEKAAGLSVQMVKLATDLGSFNNMPMDEALQRLQGTLIGSHENALAFGVVINENTLKAELAANGWDKLTGAELETAKVQARINLLMKGTSDAQGDAARTSGSWANQMRALQAELSEAATTMGAELLPVVTPLLKDFITWVREVMPQAVVIFKNWSVELKATTGPAMLMIQDALTRIAQAFGVQTDKVTISQAVLKAFKAGLDALVIALKLAAVTMQGVAWAVEKTSEAIRIAKGLSDQLGTIVKLSMDKIKGALNTVIGKWNDFKQAVKSAVNAIPTWLLPGSPTPFEIGLKGIAKATGQVANTLPQAFAVSNGGPPLAGAGGGAGGGAIIVNLTYAPVVSTASQLEAERVLAPFIAAGVRQQLGMRAG